MKRYALKPITLLALAVTLAAAPVQTQAQSNDTMVIAIPFSFTVGGEMLPAGTYTIRRASPPSLAFLIQSADHGAAAVLTHGSLKGGRRSARARLVFKPMAANTSSRRFGCRGAAAAASCGWQRPSSGWRGAAVRSSRWRCWPSSAEPISGNGPAAGIA